MSLLLLPFISFCIPIPYPFYIHISYPVISIFLIPFTSCFILTSIFFYILSSPTPVSFKSCSNSIQEAKDFPFPYYFISLSGFFSLFWVSVLCLILISFISCDILVPYSFISVRCLTNQSPTIKLRPTFQTSWLLWLAVPVSSNASPLVV